MTEEEVSYFEAIQRRLCVHVGLYFNIGLLPSRHRASVGGTLKRSNGYLLSRR